MCIHKKEKVTDNLGNRLVQLDFIDENNDTCDYFDITDDNMWTCSKNDITALQLNIRGLLNKQSSLINLIMKIAGKQKLDMIMLQETWLIQTNCSLINIPGYKHFFLLRSGHKGGGVSILVSNELTYRQNEHLCHKESYLECCTVEIQLPQTKLVVSSVYRPPNTTESKFNSLFEKLIKAICKTSKHSLIGLDQNLDLLKSNSHKPTQAFIETVLSNSHIPCITRPTRITKSSATLIDNILVSHDIYNSINCGIAISNLSDHFPCIITWPNTIKNKKNHLSFEVKKLDENFLPDIKNELSGNWNRILTGKDANESYQLFHTKFSQTLDKFTEEKKIRIPYKNYQRTLANQGDYQIK